jgi:hypothetical protein
LFLETVWQSGDFVPEACVAFQNHVFDSGQIWLGGLRSTGANQPHYSGSSGCCACQKQQGMFFGAWISHGGFLPVVVSPTDDKHDNPACGQANMTGSCAQQQAPGVSNVSHCDAANGERPHLWKSHERVAWHNA